MNRLLKPLSFALALLLVLALFPISATADAGFAIDQNGYSTPSDNNSHNLTMSFYLTYNGVRVTSLPAGVDNFIITAQTPNYSNSFTSIVGTPDYQTFPADGFTFTFQTKADAYNGRYTWPFTVTYTKDGAPVTDMIYAEYQIVNGVDPIDNPDMGVGGSNEEISKDKLQTPYDITLVSKPAAQDKMDGTVDLRLYLAYQGNQDLNDAPISYIRVEPVIPEDTKNFPFELDSSSYVKDFADLIDVRDKDGEIVETYFDFPFRVKKDAVNGTYAIQFKVYHLFANTNLQETAPAETDITTYVQIRYGKEPEEEEKPEETPVPDPSTAILLLEDYTMNPQEVKAGEEFDLTLRIRNTSDRTVTDVKSTLEEAKSTIVPVNGTNSFFIERIKAGETVEKTIRVRATPSAGVEPVSLTLKNEFVQEDAAKTSQDTFSLPIVQVANLSLDTPNYPIDCYQGESFNLMMNLYNKGRTTLYNVSVTFESDTMSADENYYAGNMESGSTREYDVMITPNADASGQVDGEIVVTYEDEDGNQTEKRTPVTVNVAAMDYGYDDMMIPDEPVIAEPVSAGFPVWGYIVIGVVVAGAVVAVIVIVRRRKKAKVDDDEME